MSNTLIFLNLYMNKISYSITYSVGMFRIEQTHVLDYLKEEDIELNYQQSNDAYTSEYFTSKLRGGYIFRYKSPYNKSLFFLGYCVK